MKSVRIITNTSMTPTSARYLPQILKDAMDRDAVDLTTQWGGHEADMLPALLDWAATTATAPEGILRQILGLLVDHRRMPDWNHLISHAPFEGRWAALLTAARDQGAQPAATPDLAARRAAQEEHARMMSWVTTVTAAVHRIPPSPATLESLLAAAPFQKAENLGSIARRSGRGDRETMDAMVVDLLEQRRVPVCIAWTRQMVPPDIAWAALMGAGHAHAADLGEEGIAWPPPHAIHIWRRIFDATLAAPRAPGMSWEDYRASTTEGFRSALRCVVGKAPQAWHDYIEQQAQKRQITSATETSRGPRDWTEILTALPDTLTFMPPTTIDGLRQRLHDKASTEKIGVSIRILIAATARETVLALPKASRAAWTTTMLAAAVPRIKAAIAQRSRISGLMEYLDEAWSNLPPPALEDILGGLCAHPDPTLQEAIQTHWPHLATRLAAHGHRAAWDRQATAATALAIPARYDRVKL